MDPRQASAPLLQVRDLRVRFRTWRGVVNALNGVSFMIGRKEILGLIGESGSGKSVTGLSILNLLPSLPGIVGGEIFFRDRDVLKIPKNEMQLIQGKEIALISQDPLSSLNPVFTIGEQLVDAILWDRINQEGVDLTALLKFHDRWTPMGHKRIEGAKEEARALIAGVGLPSPQEQLRAYPHQLSGGMRQRVLIAIALASNPALLIADEPTTALDVTVQAQILNLIKQLAESQNLSVLYISHDLSVVAQLCDRVAVMYAGRIVEHARSVSVFQKPFHPYTRALLDVISERKAGAFSEIPGEIPDMITMPPGCPFHPRCPLAVSECQNWEPVLEEKESNHWVACWRVEG